MSATEVAERWIGRPRAAFAAGGILGAFEHWHDPLGALHQLGTRALMIVPHWKARQPNGVLTIARGPRHPVVLRFAGTEAWTVGDGLVHGTLERDWGDRPIRMLEVFTTRKAAERSAAHRGEGAAEIRRLAGAALLARIDDAGVVTVNERTDVAPNGQARVYLEEEKREDAGGEDPIHVLARRLKSRKSATSASSA